MVSVRSRRALRTIPFLIAACLFALPAHAKYSGGTGEPNDPYRIATAADLIALGETPEDYHKHFILTADIDLDPKLPGRKVFDKAVIGVDWPGFTGVFDGEGHTISHLTIKGGWNLGLFDQVASAAEVKNLGVVDVNIVGSVWYVGGLVGSNYGTVTQCYSTGAVIGGRTVGGLVGFNAGVISRCYATGSVVGDSFVGGLAGENGGYDCDSKYCHHSGYVSNSYSACTVSGGECVGGLVGANEAGAVTRCYSVAEVTGDERIGGLAGAGSDDATSSFSFWDIQISGQAMSDGGTGKTTAQMQTAKTFLDAGWDFVGETANGSEDIWKIAEGLGYPRLSWQKYSGGTGTAADPYQIATAADLIALGETPADYDKHFILTADIDLDPNLPGRKVFDGAVIARPVSLDKWGRFQGTAFAGVFDGKGHTISHLTINGSDCLGLFGGLQGEVRQMGVVDVHIAGSGSYAGGLVGYNSGTVAQCYCTGVVTGRFSVGGLVGDNYGPVTQCYSTAVVTGTGLCVGGLVAGNGGTVTQCYSTGAVSGTYRVGGLVGVNDGTVTQCYSTGAVSGTFFVGGLAGLSGGDVTACFWDTQTSGQTKSVYGTGKTTAQMHDPQTFMAAAWDFVGKADGGSDIWAEPKDAGYPILWWQLSPWPTLPTFSGGTGEPNDPYRISTAKDLNSIGYNPRLMQCHFKLVADLDLTGVPFSPIGWVSCPYGGVFDGLGHAISHLTIKGVDCVGPFGQLAPGGQVRNLGILDVNVVASGWDVGGLVGCNVGPATQCYSAGAVRGTGQGAPVCGLVGYGSQQVLQCFWDTQTSGQTCCGETGKTTAEMQTAKTFLDAGWDFVGETANGTEDIWWILEGKDYPKLWWEAAKK